MGYNCDTCPNFSGCQSIPPCASHSSRPAPSAPEDSDNGEFSLGTSTPCKIFTEEQLTKHNAAIRKEALDLLEQWDYHNTRNFLAPHPVFADMIRLVREKPDEVKKHLESLRREVPE